MVQADKMSGALLALQWVIIRARNMSYDGSNSKQVADILDGAEFLAGLLADRVDRMTEFRRQLEHLSSSFEQMRPALHKLDGTAE